MLNLIRADLYRITRWRGLRGTAAPYLLSFLALELFLIVVAWGLGITPFTDFNGTTGDAAGVSFTFALGQVFISSKILVLYCAFGTIGIASEDIDRGFARSLVSGLRGRLSYFAAKIVFAGIWSLMALVVCAVGILVLIGFQHIVLGGPFFAAEPLGPALLWLLETWLTCWALSAILLLIAWVTHSKTIAFLGAWLISASVVSSLLDAAASVTAALSTGPLESLATMVGYAIPWMPSQTFADLQAGADSFLAGSGSFLALRAAIVAVAWLAAAAALALIAARHRDV